MDAKEYIQKTKLAVEWKRITDLILIASELIEEKNPRLANLLEGIAQELGDLRNGF